MSKFVETFFRVQYILLKYKKYIQLYNGYIQIIRLFTYKYINKLHTNNKVYIYIHNCYRLPNITNDKEEEVQLIYLSIDTKSRQQYCTSVVQ